MQTTRITRWAAVAMLAGLALAAAACSGSGGDKAGGADKAEPRVLTIANPNQDRAPQLERWAEEVSRLSGGTLEINFKDAWRIGEPQYEAGTLEDMRAGKVDMAWVGARAFDTVGVTSFQALVAPLLIDSYDLEAKVFEQGIPERMLEGVGDLDLIGIGVLPGPMRKLLGVSKPFVRPGDFVGQVVGLQDSTVAAETLGALGATPRAVPSSAKLDGLDAYEQHLGAIEGNSYDTRAKHVTANVNLWPRPLVIVMGKEAFASLTDEQQSSLRNAAAAAIPKALEASRAEDEEAAALLCKRGMTFAAASESDLAELRTALEPVYAGLAADPETKSHIQAITSLKTEIAASAEAPACTPADAAAGSAIPDGTYETTLTKADWGKLTKADWLKSGVPEEEGAVPGVYRMIFDGGELTILNPKGEPGFEASYTLFRDQIEAQEAEDFKIVARWSLEGDTLTFRDIRIPGSDTTTQATVVWTSHPWVLRRAKRTPIDGTYETKITRDDWVQAGVHGETTGVFTLELTEGTVILREPSGEVGFQALYTLFRDKFEAVGDPDTLTARWSFDGTSLRFTELGVCGGSACAPSDEVTPYHVVWESHPWTRVD